jgi:glycerol-3-phosphate dehydrogenase (NAD(P)+)
MATLSVIGAGSWGTALAAHLARAGHSVRLWARGPDVASAINERHVNPDYLPGLTLPEGIDATTDLTAAAGFADVLFVVIPSAFCRDAYRRLAGASRRGAVLVSATKGLETGTLRRMSEVAAEEAPGRRLAVLSGPSFALEVAQGQPTTVVVAAADPAVGASVQQAVSGRTFRAYTTDDVPGVELAGALKNVIAIAAGIVDGLGYGRNTAAALITRGLAEITRLSVALGGRPETLSGLAGLGDLVLTCTGTLSRNRQVGRALGSGLSLAEAVAATHMVAEGVHTTLAACALAERVGVEMPIAEQMRAVLHQGKPARAAVDELMLRSLKREVD